MTSFILDLKLPNSQLEALINSFTNDQLIKPELIEPSKLKNPLHYKKLQNIDKKNAFRNKILTLLSEQWSNKFGVQKTESLLKIFKQLIAKVEEDGAIILADLITQIQFQKFVNQYDNLMNNKGSNSWIHSYVNLCNHPDFLLDAEFKDVFLSPLLIITIAYMVGGPIRIVDARAKNAEPISVLAQDNMLHIDNTPFNDEYKVIVTWEKGKVSGPKGQNFAFIPGTNKGVRNCLTNADGTIWSSENASIFITEASIDNIFEFQRRNTLLQAPTVVEASHETKPLTIAFAAGSLVHHRYRTSEKQFSRSCIIVAFQRISDNPGAFLDDKFLPEIAQNNDMYNLLFSQNNMDSEEKFMTGIEQNVDALANILQDINHRIEVIEPAQRTLTQAELDKWKQMATAAPTVTKLKNAGVNCRVGETLSKEEFVEVIKNMMLFDKHGPLDLILYHDNHEECRKWARNRIREMSQNYLVKYLDFWSLYLTQPQAEDILNLTQLTAVCKATINWIEHIDQSTAQLDGTEKISVAHAHKSLKQLIIDLNEFILRCDSSQAYISVSLFLFWTINELLILHPKQDFLLDNGSILLKHYIASCFVVEQHRVIN